MNFVVVIVPKVRSAWMGCYYLSRKFADPLRGRKKSKLPRQWQWDHSPDQSDAFVFDDIIEALKQARLIDTRFNGIYFEGTVGQVWSFNHLTLQVEAQVWPGPDVVSAIGRLSD